QGSGADRGASVATTTGGAESCSVHRSISPRPPAGPRVACSVSGLRGGRHETELSEELELVVVEADRGDPAADDADNRAERKVEALTGRRYLDATRGSQGPVCVPVYLPCSATRSPSANNESTLQARRFARRRELPTRRSRRRVPPTAHDLRRSRPRSPARARFASLIGASVGLMECRLAGR